MSEPPKLSQSLEYIRSKIGTAEPKVGIICGSGLGGLQYTLDADAKTEISYSDIPGFAQSTVQGHEGKFVFGSVGGLPVAILVGRSHYYEGHPMERVVFPTKILSELGVSTLIVTNAAGGLNPEYRVGDLVLILDHINLAGFTGVNPLIGANDDRVGPRFPAFSDAYDLNLRIEAFRLWKSLPEEVRGKNRTLHAGVYAYSTGPAYESRAECRMLQRIGADVVGMSTVPEVIVAKHRSMKIMALSLVTNRAVDDRGFRGDEPELQGKTEEELAELLAIGKAKHEEVIAASQEAATASQALVKELLQSLAQKLRG